MCRSLMLHHTEHGCVSLCSECSKIQICFGTTATVHSYNEFSTFCRMIDDLLETRGNTESRFQKTVFISTQIENLMLAFSIEELEYLNDLLSQASAMLSIRSILLTERCKN